MARRALLLMVSLVGEMGAIAAVPERHYLKGAEARRPCGEPGESGEIVVCGKRDDGGDRLYAPDDATYAARPLKAEVGLGDGKTLGVGLARRALTPAQQKAMPDERSVKFGMAARLTLTVPLPAVH